MQPVAGKIEVSTTRIQPGKLDNCACRSFGDARGRCQRVRLPI